MQTEPRVLVTGSSGFVGSRLVGQLAVAGISGWAVSRTRTAVPQQWSWRRRDEMLSACTASGPRVTAIIHLEVKQHVLRPSARDLLEFHSVNVGGTQQWLDWCAANAVHRFVYFSSIKTVEPVAGQATTEDAAGTEESPYGRSKWVAEQRVRHWVAQDPRRSALILRPSVVYGPGNVANVAAMVSAIHRHRFFLVGRNANVKSLVSVHNVAAAVVHLLDRMLPGACDVYNLVDRESFSVREIDAMIRARLGRTGNSPALPPPLARAAARLGDAFHRVSGRTFPINSPRLDALLEHTHFSCQKLINTGFRHPQSTEEGLGEMVEWYLKQSR